MNWIQDQVILSPAVQAGLPSNVIRLNIDLDFSENKV